MSEADSTGKTPFDLDRLQQLVEMMEKHGLSEVNLRRGDEQWRLRRGAREVVHAAPPQMTFAAPAPSAAPVAQSAAVAAPAEPSGLIDIKSPTVGTFYAAPSPGEPAFVTVGSVVTPETIVCLLEAMKVFNQIPSEVSGTITAILVKSGDAIEFGQPLFRVRP
ncbi:MAG: acetyl-CoA carboxylase biotin carboxyl carrier protein [Planctomycetota bacterium]|nr:acetyl-CoA carboxylase biotin carboxyl carrier protein [Planctomycetales bacterium]RLS44403.1 MAG: acetyl-CoA carboxylase biotin carboxyl carrier protein [Planctomycetota bacterium]